MNGLPHHHEGGQALLDGCWHIRHDENVGRPLLEMDHPVLEAGKRDEGIHSGLHCENISSDTTLNWKASIARSFGLKVARSSTEMPLGPLNSAGNILVNGPERPPAVSLHLVLYSFRDNFLSPQIVCDWRSGPENSRSFQRCQFAYKSSYTIRGFSRLKNAFFRRQLSYLFSN